MIQSREISGSTLVATMGGQAQVVTFALDWLLNRGENVREVIALHLSPANARVGRALAQLAAEFPGDHYTYAGRPCRFRHLAVRTGDGPLADIRDEPAAEATWRAVHDLIAMLKGQGRRLHLCVAGGRRVMGLLATSAAMLYFGHYDKLWHLYTPDDLRLRAFEGALMHTTSADGVRLIEVPLLPWGPVNSPLRELVGLRPAEAIAARLNWLEEPEQSCCRQVLDGLTARQRAVLRAFAEGCTPQEAAERLGISLNTINSHKTTILGKCRNAWNVPPETRLDYHFLRDKFGPYFGRR